MRKFLHSFNTPAAQMPGYGWWGFIILASLVLGMLPSVLGLAPLFDLSVVLVLALLALSMSFLWGYLGLLSFGQTAFFGTGGYVYAVAAMNMDGTTLPFVLGITLPMVLAAVIGYFMIYGKLSDIYFSVMTLVITLIMNKAMRATSGSQYVVGDVRLNGQNGIPGVPPLQVPWNPSVTLFIDHIYYLSAALVVLVYVGLRLLLTTSYGRVLIGIRENEQRIELLGYDSRFYKLLAFILAGGLAGLSGTMFAVWGNFVGPEMFGLGQAAQIIIWVIVGGKATLIGPIVGVGLIQYLTTWLGMQGVGQVTLVLGAILIVFVLAFKDGLVPTVGNLILRLMGKEPSAPDTKDTQP